MEMSETAAETLPTALRSAAGAESDRRTPARAAEAKIGRAHV